MLLHPIGFTSSCFLCHLFLGIFFNKFIYLFIFGCVGSSFLCEGFLQLRQAGATLHHGAWTSHCCGLSCCGARLQMCRLSSCGSRAQLLRGMWDPPRPGLEPVSPASAGRLSTTVPPGKPSRYFLVSSLISSVISRLFSSVLFSLHVFGFFTEFFP